jgi:hypothetical protein
MDAYEHEELIDEALEKEIEAALGVDPSPEFLPRIRARIASERVSAGWIWFAPWRWAGAALAVVAVAIAALWISDSSVPAPREAHVTAVPPVEPARRVPEVVASSAESSKPARASGVRTVRSTRRPVEAHAEVVISPNDAMALRQLVVAIAARQIEAVDIPKLGAESAPLPPIEEIVLEPIELSPIAGLEGE